MKIVITGILGLLLNTAQAFALPVLNANTGGAAMSTVLPDHLDRNLYYVGPTVFLVSKDASGLPNFNYTEYRAGSGSRRGLVQVTLRPDFSYEALSQAKAEILKINPAARFAALPFVDTKVNFTDQLRDLLVSSNCQHTAATVADEQTCAFLLNSRGNKALGPQLKRGLTFTVQFKYNINGVQQNADGTYTSSSLPYQVAGRIGGPELANFPDLFRALNDRR